MKGVCLKLYTYEFQKHQSELLYEWLLEFAKNEGIKGGTVFRGIAGFGRHKNIHAEHFFELAGNVPIEVSFILTDDECQQFIKKLKKEKLALFYVTTPVEYEELSTE